MYEQSNIPHQMQKSMSYGDASRQNFVKSSMLNQLTISTLILVVLKRNHHKSSSELKSKIPENHCPSLRNFDLTPTFH